MIYHSKVRLTRLVLCNIALVCLSFVCLFVFFFFSCALLPLPPPPSRPKYCKWIYRLILYLWLSIECIYSPFKIILPALLIYIVCFFCFDWLIFSGNKDERKKKRSWLISIVFLTRLVVEHSCYVSWMAVIFRFLSIIQSCSYASA